MYDLYDFSLWNFPMDNIFNLSLSSGGIMSADLI